MIDIDPVGTKAPKRRWAIAVGVLILIGIAGALVLVRWGLRDFGGTTGPFPDPETLIEPCADADADTMARIEANLVGEPAPTIGRARTSAFNIDGEEIRVIVVSLVGPGVPDDAAVFIVDPSGTIYAEAHNPAQAFSTFETVTLDSDEWEEPNFYAARCL